MDDTPKTDQIADARKAHERALARARQQRKRDRERHAVTVSRHASHAVVTDVDTGKPSLTLTRIARNLAAGMNKRQALREAGSSEKAVGLIDKARIGLAEVLKANGLDTVKVVQSTKESIEAKTPVWNPAGNESIERPDWNARAQGRRDAIALLDRAGELPSPQAAPGGPSITVNIVRFEQPQHIVDVTPDNACETLTIEKQ